MELHRSGRNDRMLSLVGIGYGLVSFVVGGVFALMGGALGAVTVFVWVSGGFFFLVGLFVLGMSFAPFRIAMDESRLVIRCEGTRFEGSWDLVDAVHIERGMSMDQPPKPQHVLVLWVVDGVKMAHRPTYPPGSARPGHFVVNLNNVKETPEEVAAILSRYAGQKFRSLARA